MKHLNLRETPPILGRPSLHQATIWLLCRPQTGSSQVPLSPRVPKGLYFGLHFFQVYVKLQSFPLPRFSGRGFTTRCPPLPAPHTLPSVYHPGKGFPRQIGSIPPIQCLPPINTQASFFLMVKSRGENGRVWTRDSLRLLFLISFQGQLQVPTKEALF